MRRASSGLSLLEVVVVLAITVTVLVTALPILYALLREQRGLTAEVLRGETLPFLHSRIDRDLASARALDVGSDPETLTTSLTLPPRDEKAPTIVWDLSATALSRREVPADGSDGPPPHTWTLAGALAVLPDEIAAGRLGLLWRPSSGMAEVLIFETPRADEELK